MAEQHAKNTLNQLETTLDLYFNKKAPALPQNIKELLVNLAPYLTVVSVIITLPGLLVLFGLGGFATMLAPMGGRESLSAVPTMWLSILFLVPVLILEVMAIPGLFVKKAVAWKYIFWAQLVSILANLLQWNLFGAIIGAVISFYILFQIKSFYK